MSGMFVPTYQGLTPGDFIRPAAPQANCFPFDAPERMYFYRARNAIYHLFRALASSRLRLTVLAPDYNSGNEILAMRAAGATIHYYPVGRNLQADPDEVERRCAVHNPDVLYVIHYVGWPQPMPALVDLCKRREMLLVEDCALSLLSELEGRSLGTFGDWSIFCLYKTLPLPNGALLVQNTAKLEPFSPCSTVERRGVDRPVRTALEALKGLPLRRVGSASVLGRTAELIVQRIRSRANGVGAALQTMKRGMGRAMGALEVRRANVGDIGFNLADVDLAMSRTSARLLQRLDFHDIRRRRLANYRHLSAELNGDVTHVCGEPADGVCPLFFPVLVPDKQAAAAALQQRGIDALEFWNDSVESGAEMSPDAQFLRTHVLELPIHQDLTPRHIDYVAQQVRTLNLRMAS